MRTSLLICGLITATASAAVVDTSFMDEREKLAKDWTGKGGDPAEKYFRKLFLDVVIVVVFGISARSIAYSLHGYPIENVRLTWRSR